MGPDKGMWVVGALTLLLFYLTYTIYRSQRCFPHCKVPPSKKDDPRFSAVGDFDVLQCTLFTAIYLPWTEVPLFYTPRVYQPSLSNFLFRLNWNVTTTNCLEHRWDFAPPKTFDTVVRVSTGILGFNRMYAYFLHSSEHKLAILSFTGTAFTDDWARNTVYIQTTPYTLANLKENIACHLGFYEIYLMIQQEVNQLVKCYRKCTERFVITGYSLGGALATLAAFDLAQDNPLVYTFGAPRVFNPTGAKHLNRITENFWRIFNTEDLVADMPPANAGANWWIDPLAPSDIVYEHSGKPVAWTDSRGSWLDNHSRAYELWLLADSRPKTCGVF